MARSLVTGGAGFIGSHLVEALVATGEQVRVLDDYSTGKPENLAPVHGKIELVRGSVADPRAAAEAVAGCEVVYHLAAIASVQKSVEDPWTTHAVCAGGTLILLDAARRAGVRRLVYAASSSCYGDQSGGARTEDDPLIPLSPYAAAKLAGEHYCLACTRVYGVETVRLRFFNIFGPRQDPLSPYSGVIALFARALAEGRRPTIHGDGLQSRDFVFVADAVQALMKGAKTPQASGRVYNVGTGRGTTVLELVQKINQILGAAVSPIHGPARAGDVRESLADIRRARQELGYEPSVHLEEGLRRTLAG